MTTRNFRVHNGISVGDVTLSASTNKITGLSTSAPSADGDVATKKYVDDSVASLSSTTLTAGNTTAVVSDTGSDGTFTVTCDGNTELTVTDTGVRVYGNLTVDGTQTIMREIWNHDN